MFDIQKFKIHLIVVSNFYSSVEYMIIVGLGEKTNLMKFYKIIKK
jgi:hypothetical protein